MKYWETIADNLSKAGWSWGCVSAIDREGEPSGLWTRIGRESVSSYAPTKSSARLSNLNLSRIHSMTTIEIRPHRWGWKAFESPGVEPVPKQGSGIRLRPEPRLLPLRRDSDSRFNRQRRARHPVRQRESQAMMPRFYRCLPGP
jgi:hypothetical protein